VGGVIFTIGFQITRRRRQMSIVRRRELTHRQNRDELLGALAAFGHSGMARSNLERLAQYAEAAPAADDPRRAEFEQRVAGIVRTYNEFTRGILKKIIALAAYYKEHKGDVEKLAADISLLDQSVHSGKLPEGITEDSVAQLPAIASRARAILVGIRDLRARIMDTIRTDVSGAVCRVLAAQNERLTQAGVKKRQITISQEDLAIVDEECLKTTLEILLNNAAEAMINNEKCDLALNVSRDGDFMTVRVTDTGCGIDEEEWERIFERDVSTKGDGRGLGLYYARQDLAKYGGSLRVESSRPGQGTVMALRLRSAPQSQVPQ
jgi:signal transduction histidine kinase